MLERFFLGRSRLLQYGRSRAFSSHAVFRAQRVLGLHEGGNYTGTQLRDAYYSSAKKCHPDLINSDDCSDIARAAHDFMRLSEAYEYLSKSNPRNSFVQQVQSQEDDFRRACEDWLGVSPEVVEESKQCPMFRAWLLKGGKSAQTWLNFFRMHGGLAPQLCPKVGISAGEVQDSNKQPKRRHKRYGG